MEEKMITDCGTLHSATDIYNGVNVHGVIAQVFDAKEFKRQKTQFILVKDDTGKIGVKVAGAPFKNEHVGLDIKIENAVWTSYPGKDGTDKWFLEASKGAEVKYQNPATAPAKTLTNSPRKTQEEMDQSMLDAMDRCFKLAATMLKNESLGKDLHTIVDNGWSAEDLRTLATSLFIESNRNKGLVK